MNNRKRYKNKFGDTKLVGIGGWLLLPIAGLFIAIYEAFRLFMSDGVLLFKPALWSSFTTEGSLFYHSYWVPVIVLGALIQLSMAIFSVIALIAIFKKKYIVPKIMIGIYILAFMLVIVDLLITLYFLPQINQNLANDVFSESIKKFISVIIGGLIWIPYFLKSVRVRNTFVE